MKLKGYSAQEIANGAKSGQWEQQNRKNNVMPASLPQSANQGSGTRAAEVARPAEVVEVRAAE